MYEIGEEEIQAVAGVIRSGQLFRYRGGENGECTHFEQKLREKMGCEYALAVNSGTSALVCSLVACDVGPGDEVIVPAFTFMATAMAVLAVGAVPVIAEIDDSLTLCPKDAELKITSRTKAIIPVHMSGLPCAMDRFVELGSRYHIRIIEDGCQSVGGSYRGRSLGTIGDIGCFSFNQFKIISAGEGGAIVTNDRTLFEKALIQHDGGCVFRSHASKMSVPIFVGGNYRISEITGAVLRVQLDRLDGILQKLRQRRTVMAAELEGSAACRLAPLRCAQGDCAQALMIQVDTEKRMRRLLQILWARGIAAATPADSTGHVYTHWKPVLQQQAANHPKMNAFSLTDSKYNYTKEMCPATLSILSRTVGIAVDIKESLEQARDRAQTVRSLAESF